MLSSQLSKQAKPREAIMMLVVVLGIVYLAYNHLYIPKKAKCEELKEQITAFQEQEESINKLINALEVKHKKITTEMEKQHEVQQSALDTSNDPRILMLKKYRKSLYKNVSEFLNSVMQTTSLSSVTVEAMKQELPIKKEGYNSTGFSVNLLGRFTDIIEMIENLEELPALITLDTMELKVNGADSNMVNVNIIGTFFKLESDNAY